MQPSRITVVDPPLWGQPLLPALGEIRVHSLFYPLSESGPTERERERERANNSVYGEISSSDNLRRQELI